MPDTSPLPSWIPRSLRRQFQFAVTILTLLILAGGITAVYALHTSSGVIQVLTEERLNRMQDAQDLVQRTLLIERESYQLAEARSLQELKRNYAAIVDQLAKLDQIVDKLAIDNAAALLDLRQASLIFRSTANIVAQLRETELLEPRDNRANQRFLNELRQQAEELVKAAQLQSYQFTLQYRQTARQLGTTTQRNAQWVIMLLTGGLMLAGAISQWFLGRHVLGRLQEVSRNFQPMEEQETQTATRDEIGILAGTFDAMSDQVRMLVSNLQQSETLYRTLFENSPISIWEEDFSRVQSLFRQLRDEGITDIEAYFDKHPETIRQCAELAKVIRVNRAALALHEADSEEELLSGFSDTFTPESLLTFREELTVIWNGGMNMHKDAVVQTLAGELRHVSVYFSVCPGHEATLSRVIVSLVDITDRKRAEQALIAHEREYHTLIENLPDCVARFDSNGRHLYVNAAVEKTFGLPREFLIGSPLPESGRPGIHDQNLTLDQFIRHVFETAEIQKIEAQWQTTDGPRIFEIQHVPELDEHGNVGSVLCIAHDVTFQKQAEEALRISSERLQLATYAAQIGIWDWDIVKNELLWDDSMYQLYGVRREDFGGAYDAWARTIHPEDRAYTEGEIQAALHGEHEYAPEFRIVRPDGSIRHIKAESKTIKDRDGKPLRMIGTNIDITERKLSEEVLRRYKDQLEETVRQRTEELSQARDAAEAANRSKSLFLANMSHELRTPLNAILGFSQMMRQDSSLNSSQRDTLDIINRSGEHLLSLINDVLEIAKIESGKLQLEVAPFDLGAMVRDVEEMMRLRAEQKGLTLELDLSSEFPRYIKGDEARLRQILVNLVGNAVKFTDTGGITIRLGVRENARHHLLLEVEDTGPGIAAEDRERLLQPFIQLAGGTVKGGTGLGLAITRQFVELMGGNIVVESTLGKGSLFRVDLPLELPAESEIVQLGQQTLSEVTGLAPGQPAYRILIAEDQPENQLLLAQLMAHLGLETKVAANGELCVQLFREWHPDLIWMDWRMPVMDGIEATRRIRALPGGDKVKIVAVTASVFREQQPEILAAGMDDMVRKPYHGDEIYACMARLLGLEFISREIAKPRGEPEPLNPQDLAALPDELRTELKNALEQLDSTRIAAVIQRIQEIDRNLGDALSALANNFDYPAILSALSSADKSL